MTRLDPSWALGQHIIFAVNLVLLSAALILLYRVNRERANLHETPNGRATTEDARLLQQQQQAMKAFMHANMEMLSAQAELALEPSQRAAWWGNMGHIGQVPNEVDAYALLSTLPGVNTICEIGFNAGHSTSVMLTANPQALMYSFDLAALPYSALALATFRRTYPTRFHWIQGYSSDTVPWFSTQNKTCDLFSVDGDHSYEGALTDLRNVLQIMTVGGIIVADDVSSRLPGSYRAWQEMLDAGYLRDAQCADNGPEEVARQRPEGIKRWCWARVASLTGPLDTKPLPVAAKPFHPNSFRLDPSLPTMAQLKHQAQA